MWLALECDACSWMHGDEGLEGNFEEQMQMGKFKSTHRQCVI